MHFILARALPLVEVLKVWGTALRLEFLASISFPRDRVERNSKRRRKNKEMDGKITGVFFHRGYGFVMDVVTGEEYFAHVSDFANQELLPSGSRVTFQLGEFRGKTKAIKIEPCGTSQAEVSDEQLR